MTSPILGEFLGGTTGYAINPARDLSPRIAHAILPSGAKEAPTGLTLRFPLSGHFSAARLPACSCVLFLSSKEMPAVLRDDLKTEWSEVTDDSRAAARVGKVIRKRPS